MAHLVRYRTSNSEVMTEEVSDLETAIGRVEVLRNEGAVDDVRVWAEVPLRVETVVRVSVATAPTETGADGAPASASTGDVPVDEGPEEPAGPVEPPPGAMLSPVRVEAPSADAEDLVDTPAGETRRGIFNRG